MVNKELDICQGEQCGMAEDESIYSPGQRGKKKAMMIMSVVAWSKLEFSARFAATKAMCFRTCIGISFMCEESGFSASRQPTCLGCGSQSCQLV